MDTLHRLLDLQCATNNGFGGPDFFEGLPFVDRGSLPEPEELFYAAENRLLNTQSSSIDSEIPIVSLEAPGTVADLGESEVVENATEIEIEKEETNTEDVLSAEPSSWHKNCPAEQIWTTHKDVLRTSAGYTAMIRGAARFGAADRAWNLAEEALSSSVKLPLSVYNALLRCAHECSLPSKGIDDVWTLLCHGFELLRGAKLAPDIYTFSSALFSLYKNNAKSIRDDEKPLDCADKALGLLEEVRRLNLQPNLGFYTNLLRSVLTSRLHLPGQAYRVTELLADVLADIESRWDPGPSRADIFNSVDDYDFACTAMLCASVDPTPASVLLIQRVYDLIHSRGGDRRFLLRNSLEVRSFYSRYLMTKMLHGVQSGDVQTLSMLYRHHRQVFQANQRVYEILLHLLKGAINRWSEVFNKLKNGETIDGKTTNAAMIEDFEASASKAFELLGEMIFDFVAISTRLPRRLPLYISDSLMVFSFVGTLTCR